MRVAIIKYNAGNIGSVANAVRRLGIEPVVTDDTREIQTADRVIFPGQGEASGAMAYLRERGMDSVIRGLHQPVLGICIGMQLLCRHSEEGDTNGLGVFDAEVRRFAPTADGEKVPHMGWNTIGRTSSPLFEGFTQPEFVYFVHSFYVPVCQDTIATTYYTADFSAALGKGNFLATQFHPEKSGSVGERILRNFIKID